MLPRKGCIMNNILDFKVRGVFKDLRENHVFLTQNAGQCMQDSFNLQGLSRSSSKEMETSSISLQQHSCTSAALQAVMLSALHAAGHMLFYSGSAILFLLSTKAAVVATS